MSARRVSEKGVTIPQNAHFLDFTRSDGDSSRWPTDTTEVIDNEGQVNFMKPVGIDDGPSIRWRVGVGQGVAKGLNLAAGPTYVIRDWPTGYAFYDHHKGRAEEPRHDLYLFGSKSRYRSVNEFIPHALWLMQDPSSSCLCKYCQKTTQKEVHAIMAPGILRRTHATQSPTPSRVKPQRSKVKLSREGPLKDRPEPKIYASVQKRLLPRSFNVHPKHTMLVERNADLRASRSKLDAPWRRWYRVGELVWCALDRRIPSFSEGIALDYWPGLVEEPKLKPNITPQPTDAPYSGSAAHEQLIRVAGDDGDVVMAAPTGSVPWKVHQSMEYRIQLLGVNHSLLTPDDHLLPYQAYIPPTELIEELRKCPLDALNFERESLSKFNPCPKGEVPDFTEAIAPYAAAIEIASVISNFWCLTDEWTFEYTVPVPLPKAVPRTERVSDLGGVASLQAALQNASLQNSQYYQDVSGPKSGMSTPDVERLSARVVGKTSTGTQSQTRFQGLWWGAERIWVDEFVRLKVPRACIAPNGAPNILPPSTAGVSARKAWIEQGKDPAELGAGIRGVFMHMNGLFVVDALQDDGVTYKKECRASGMLYELADFDWVDPNVSRSEKDDSNAATSTQATTSGSASTAPLTFVPAPSPLNPHVPPRTEALTSTAPPPSSAPLVPADFSPSNLQLSHPNHPPYFLPAPPDGYTFRPILTEGYEAVISLSLISGRYYPQILSHPLLATTVGHALEMPVLESNNLWALEGLSAGYYNSVDPTRYKASRSKMVEDADRAAIESLENHKRQKLSENESPSVQMHEGNVEMMEID